ncbi:Flp1 family type IVb pilin [Paenibacillus chartarius]|uniref:Flp1 family type IVb pilin n=1 Tax=Paenibacillus chartarius TaxID=747481 RepID=A0ABV6DPV9_9BACL
MAEIQNRLQRLWNDEDGLGTLEVLLIVAVLVAIAIVFRKWIVGWFQDILGKANGNLKDSTVSPCVPGPTTDCTAP